MLVSRRYERASLIVTSNKPFSAWGEIFGDDAVATAAIDRLVHHAEKDGVCRAENPPAYPPEFRREAIELLRAGRAPRELSESLSVSEQTLRNWRRQDQIDRRERDDGVTTDERAEHDRVRVVGRS
jgi:hypothetical protein